MKESLAIQPAARVVRDLARKYLDQAAQAAQRLSDPQDTEALHDFRVALRRLRSLLAAHKTFVKSWLPKKLRRRVKELAAGTGPARDTEVQIAWMEQQRGQVKSHQRPGYQWMMGRLEQRLQEEYQDLHETLPDALGRLHKRMHERLDLIRDDESPPFGAVTAARLLESAEDFRRHLLRVAGDDGEADEAVHQARIKGKRLRYLLEPVAAELDGGKELIRELKDMQNLMGEIHDIQVFSQELGQASEEAGAERLRRLIDLSLTLSPDHPDVEAARRQDERAGLMSLARELHDRHEHLMSRLRAKLTEGEGARFLEHLAAAVAQLQQISANPAADD
ncbi:CHAD domain-containing protein [Ectothiorhodospira lacustris]|uniref:CHAD domain-containing protein n=1 Tax=Ectothiorhodospira lacustris TaxID=2899127 RepID=UPI001EE92042|nr:CHAD domain-containing protein [Ectothiorhodospira lacustris]MCG5499332.1 CHAD domain-containing protein [Ectothiorhodospira lacustris]MCG5509221.1 CHAD domain-containing protein [Ectothiorhodospira lacustris]MCG5521011.1 CHAD domain-containing protein [Ectothiorhodospira lacustris]